MKKINPFWLILFYVYAQLMVSGTNMMKEGGNYEPLACSLKSSADGGPINDAYNAKLKKVCAVKGTTIDTWKEFTTALFVFPIAIGSVTLMSIRYLVMPEEHGQEGYWQVTAFLILFLIGPAIGSNLRDLSKYQGKAYYILGCGFTLVTACFGSWMYTGNYFNLGGMIISLLTLNIIGILCFGMAVSFGIGIIQSFLGGGRK
jgi:hypothetical protein